MYRVQNNQLSGSSCMSRQVPYQIWPKKGLSLHKSIFLALHLWLIVFLIFYVELTKFDKYISFLFDFSLSFEISKKNCKFFSFSNITDSKFFDIIFINFFSVFVCPFHEFYFKKTLFHIVFTRHLTLLLPKYSIVVTNKLRTFKTYRLCDSTNDITHILFIG